MIIGIQLSLLTSAWQSNTRSALSNEDILIPLRTCSKLLCKKSICIPNLFFVKKKDLSITIKRIKMEFSVSIFLSNSKRTANPILFVFNWACRADIKNRPFPKKHSNWTARISCNISCAKSNVKIRISHFHFTLPVSKRNSIVTQIDLDSIANIFQKTFLPV